MAEVDYVCKQDVDSKIDLKKMCDSRSLRLSRSCHMSHMSHAQLNMICIALFIARQQRSMLMRDIDITNLFVCPSVCPSVRPSVRNVPVSDKNGLTYRRSFFTIRYPNHSSFTSIKHFHEIPTGSLPAGR